MVKEINISMDLKPGENTPNQTKHDKSTIQNTRVQHIYWLKTCHRENENMEKYGRKKPYNVFGTMKRFKHETRVKHIKMKTLKTLKRANKNLESKQETT